MHAGRFSKSQGGRQSVIAENELRLEVAEGSARGFIIVVNDRLVIGRNSEGPGKLADDPELSRHHAEIVRAPNGEFTIEDLSSTNGTFVNGAQLKTPAVLMVGDEIEVGATKLVVRSAPVAEPPAQPEVDVRAATVLGGVGGTIRHPPEQGQVRTEPEPSVRGAPLTVRLTVNFEHATAQLSVHGTGEPIELGLDHGRWRVDDQGS